MATDTTTHLPSVASAQFNVVFDNKLVQKDISIRDLVVQPALAAHIGEEIKKPAPIERQLGETEVSYFLPSRESGVNDMYLHLGCLASESLVDRTRVSLAWTIMRLRHPLLASKVIMNDYHDIRFTYDAPLSPNEAVTLADQSLEYRKQAKDELIDSYLNGPRTLSNDQLSYLIISCSNPNDSEGPVRNFDFLICATHFLGDGMALHQFANDFFGILGSSLDHTQLTDKLALEWTQRCCGTGDTSSPTLPSPIEDRLPPPASGKFTRAAALVDFDISKQKSIGGHVFPRCSGRIRHTIVPTVSFDREKTKIILKNCKTHGVSISAALFAICNIAWARTHSEGWELPTMMYSALNMRPNLLADKRLNDSYWFIAIGYFNIVLPSFLPKSGDDASTFWHRARSAKVQSIKAAKSRMGVSRCREMAAERGARARIWAKEDDDKAAGIPNPPKPAAVAGPSKPKVPSNALMGLSLLGNLDGMYKHATFPEIKLHTLTTGSRQRAGGMLLFGYTFVDKLWVSFGYDEAGFEEKTVQTFWKNVIEAINGFLS